MERERERPVRVSPISLEGPIGRKKTEWVGGERGVICGSGGMNGKKPQIPPSAFVRSSGTMFPAERERFRSSRIARSVAEMPHPTTEQIYARNEILVLGWVIFASSLCCAAAVAVRMLGRWAV